MFTRAKTTIERQRRTIAGLREQLAEARGQAQGEDRGRHLAAEQLARDVRLGATREEQHRANAARAYGDLTRALRLVAEHVVRVREGQAVEVSAEDLVRALGAVGLPLQAALIGLRIERETAAKASASQAAGAVVDASAPPQ